MATPIIEVISLIHGFLGTIFLMAFTGSIIALFTLDKSKYKLLRYSIMLMTLSVIIIDVVGIYIYGIYRAPNPESARSKLLESNTPWVHTILMEFKEFAGIYVALIMLLISYLIFKYNSKVLSDMNLRNSVLFLLIITMLLTLLTFGLGAYITKVQPI